MQSLRDFLLKDKVIQFVLKLSKERLEVERLIVFGSRARGDSLEKSDYDIAIVCKDSKNWGRVSLEVSDRAPTLCGIDLVNLNDVGAQLKDRILKEGIVIYEARDGKPN